MIQVERCFCGKPGGWQVVRTEDAPVVCDEHVWQADGEPVVILPGSIAAPGRVPQGRASR